MLKRGLFSLLLCSLLLIGTHSAGAGDVAGKDAGGDVSAKGLTKAERDAIDIVSVRAVGEENLGLLVTVTFKGNFEQLIGRGHLKNGLVALVLRPKTTAQLPAGLVNEGAVDTDLRRTRSEVVGAVRDGRELTFFVAGGGYSNVQTVEVRAFANLSAAPRSTADAPPTLSDPRWSAVLSKRPADIGQLTAQAEQLSCDELKALLAALDERIADLDAKRNAKAKKKKRANAQRFRDSVAALIAERCKENTLGATFAWHTFSPNEVAGTGSFTGPPGNLTAIRVIVPDAGSTDRRITNFLCPSQLPRPIVSGDTITCGGGTLAVGQPFTVNLQTFPVPNPGMGGQLFAELNGSFEGPFQITGP